jgi:hypothetical protein
LRAFVGLPLTFVVLTAIAGGAQTTQQGDFGSKFFENLRTVFGRLQKTELDRAFERTRPVHCSDLSGQTDDWKSVAFLNDDRNIANWHFDTIDEVRNDPATIVFSGNCRKEEDPIRVTTAFPIKETGALRNNNPVNASFDRSSGAYVFQLPYLYARETVGAGVIYTLIPPLASSIPNRALAEEFRCKALNDPELTYRFLLCRARIVNRDENIQRQVERRGQATGSAAYYILSDGKEATSQVKLKFGDPAQ